MNCACCCTNVLNFCTQDVCGDIDFDIKTQKAGIHKMVAGFLGIQVIITADFEENVSLIFPLEMLNENYEYTVNLFDPDGIQIVIRKNDIDYDCFKFKTTIAV